MEGQQSLLDLTLGEVILILRKRQHMTVEELSAASGVPMSTLSRYERGARDIPSRALKAIATALGETPSSLVNMARGLYLDSPRPSYVARSGPVLTKPDSKTA